MTNPIPPGDNVPLYDGLDASWNDIVSAFPEDKRAEIAPILKQRVDSYESLKPWEDYTKSGLSKDYVDTALNVYSVIENNPRQVYDVLATHLNITPQQAKEVVDAVDAGDQDDPRIQRMQQQIDTLSQITIANRNQEMTAKREQEAEAALDKELKSLHQKYSDVDDEEIVMRMIAKDISAEQAYQEYSNKVTQLRTRRPAPMLMGGGGLVPHNKIDVTKLTSSDTKALTAQMLQRAIDEANH